MAKKLCGVTVAEPASTAAEEAEEAAAEAKAKSWLEKQVATVTLAERTALNDMCGLGLSEEQLRSMQWSPFDALAKAVVQLPDEDRKRFGYLVCSHAPERARWRKMAADFSDGQKPDALGSQRLVRTIANFTVGVARKVEDALCATFTDCTCIDWLRDMIVLCVTYDWRSVVTGTLLSSADSTTALPSLFHLLPAEIFHGLYGYIVSPVFRMDYVTPARVDAMCMAADEFTRLVTAFLGEDECENDCLRSSRAGRSRRGRRGAQIMSMSQPFSLFKAMRIATWQWYVMTREEHTEFANRSSGSLDPQRRERAPHAIVRPQIREGSFVLELVASPTECRESLRKGVVSLSKLTPAVRQTFATNAPLLASAEAVQEVEACGKVVMGVVHPHALNLAAMVVRPLGARSGKAWEMALAAVITSRMLHGHSLSRRDWDERDPFVKVPLASTLVGALMAEENCIAQRVRAASA